MKKINVLLTGLFIVCICPAALKAQTYVADSIIDLPGDAGYDYVSIDKPNNLLFVSHGNSVNVIDLITNKPAGVIADLKGIHGIAVDDKAGRGFISDGRATEVVAFDLKTLKILAHIALTGANGPDGIIYDPYSDRVFCFNGESNNASVVDPNGLKQIGNIDLGGGPEFAVSDGKGLVYNNLEDKNSLNVIDVKTMKVIKNFPLAPGTGPTGVTIDNKTQRVFSACRGNKGLEVVDVVTGKVITTVPIGAGVDAVVFDPQTKLIFCSNGDGTTTIIKQESADEYKVVQTLKTQYRAKTMALDPVTHKIYLSVASYNPDTRKIVPNSFKVLVYKLQ